MNAIVNHNLVLQRVKRALGLIGYSNNLLLSDYEYADVAEDRYSLRKVPLAGFAQTPPSYRNACVGVIISNGVHGARNVEQHHSLGAPMIFEIGPTSIDRWKITSSGQPEKKQSIHYDNIERVFSEHKRDWNPDRVLRAKAIVSDLGPVQLDFIDIGLMPALAGMIHKKLDRLLQQTLSKVTKTYKRYNENEIAHEDLFRLVFRLIAAKVFRDRKFSGGWDTDDPATILKAVEDHYNSDSQNVLPSRRYRREVAAVAWEEISSAFHFQNLSVDDLAFVYENTFITPQIRKKLGTHSTPPFLAEYIVRKLPFEKLPESDRRVLEPCSGGGVFLIAAMRRLRELLQGNYSDARRHKYFVDRIVGIEVDAFAMEVCRLSLMLADYPNPDGWKLHNEDIFFTDKLEQELKQAEIVLCNPPFEKFDDVERENYKNKIKCVYKPAELLRRVLASPPSLLGIVLPLAFSNGNSYRSFHHQLAENYGHIELAELPEVFNYSDVPTALLMASEQRAKNSLVSVSYCKFTDKKLESLVLEGSDIATDTKLLSVPSRADSSFSLRIPQLSIVWNYLDRYPRLGQQADIHQGIHWKGLDKKLKKGGPRTDVISDKPAHGFMKGVCKVEGHFEQFWLKGNQYLSLRPEDQKDNAYKYSWDKPKVVCNTARLRRESWRLGAVADPVGLAFSKQFIAFWPSESASIYSLAALLNSPIANAWCFANDLQIDNRIQTLRALPIPKSLFLLPGEEIDVMSRELHKCIQEKHELFSTSHDTKLKLLVLQLDAAILKAYDLPPALERELLDHFQGKQRPVPFEFDGYYPQNFTAYIPLHELISDGFQRASASHLLNQLEPIYDKKTSEMVAWLTRN